MAAVLAACSEDSVPDVPQEPTVPDGNGTPISFSGGIFAEAPSTKADFTDNGAVKIAWTAGEDIVGIFGSTASGSIGDNAAYAAVPGQDNLSACTFEAQGAELTWQAGGGTHTFYAYYPYVRMRNPDPQNVASEVPAAQTQEGVSMSHVAASAFMAADKAELAESTGSVNLRFTHIYGVMQFVLDAETPMTLSGLTMTSAAADLAGMVTVDLSQPYDRCITAVTDGSRSVALDFGAAGLALGDGTPKSAYLLVLPGTHPAGSISLTFQTADGGAFTKTIWKSTDVAFTANVKSKQAIKPLTEADFAAKLGFSVVSVTAEGDAVKTPFGFGTPVINGADITVPLTTEDASGKVLTPNGKVPVTVTCKVGSETSNRTLTFADVRDVQTFSVSGISYKARLSYTPQLPNSGFEEPWSRDGNNKYDIMTFWGSGNFYTKFLGFIEVTNAGTSPATGVTPRSSESAPFVESGKAANLKTNEIMSVAAAGSMFTGTMTAPAAISDASATRKLTKMGMPFRASAKLLGLKADVKYTSGGSTKDGTYDMGSFVVELLKNIDESKPFEYHAYGTEGKGPGVDPNVTDDGYGSTARRAAFGAFYISDKATSFTIPYATPVACNATVVPADTWTEIYIPIDYPEGADADYDYFNISCSSSARGDQTQAAAGSSLTIDNIRLVYE